MLFVSCEKLDALKRASFWAFEALLRNEHSRV
jgi:hypothetical protein